MVLICFTIVLIASPYALNSIAIPLIQRGANINVPVSHINDDYKKWEAEQKKRKGKQFWTWQKKKEAAPEKVTTVSLLYKVVEKGWQGVLYLLMDRLERFGLRKTAIVQVGANLYSILN